MEMIVYGYFLIATYLAWVFLTGRSEWLDQKNIVGICAKLFITQTSHIDFSYAP